VAVEIFLLNREFSGGIIYRGRVGMARVEFSNNDGSVFGNGYRQNVYIDGRLWSSVEQYMKVQRIIVIRRRGSSWDMEEEEGILFNALTAKFVQNKHTQKELLATGQAYLVCRTDNRLGELLMDLRDLLFIPQ